jgi:hypothetical protein
MGKSPQLMRGPLGRHQKDCSHVERRYCYSCRDWHGFLDSIEWGQVEPLWRQGQRSAAQAGRIARRLRKPIANDSWKNFFKAALAKYTEITGDPIDNPHSLYHRQLIHECKWRPRSDEPPPREPGSKWGAA